MVEYAKGVEHAGCAGVRDHFKSSGSRAGHVPPVGLIHDLPNPLADGDGYLHRGRPFRTLPADPGQDVGHALLHDAEDRRGRLRLGTAQDRREVAIGVVKKLQREPIDSLFILRRQGPHHAPLNVPHPTPPTALPRFVNKA